jgi:hypothetical protein
MVRLRKTSKDQCPGWDSNGVPSSHLHSLSDCIADRQHSEEGVELMCPSWISHSSCGLCLTSKRNAPSCPPACPLFNPSSWVPVSKRLGNNCVEPNAIFKWVSTQSAECRQKRKRSMTPHSWQSQPAAKQSSYSVLSSARRQYTLFSVRRLVKEKLGDGRSPNLGASQSERNGNEVGRW